MTREGGINYINMEIGLGEMLNFVLDIQLIMGKASGGVFEIVGNPWLEFR